MDPTGCYIKMGELGPILNPIINLNGNGPTGI